MPRIATAHLKSISPYGPSKHVTVEKLDREPPDDYEKRTWRERCHYDPKTLEVFIPPMAFKGALDEAARRMGRKIKGKGNSTYTKHFEAGVMVMDPMPLGVKKDDIEGQWLFLNADGKRGGGTRVMRCMPFVPDWEGKVTFYIFDNIVTKQIFEETLEEAGALVGIGQFRPQNRGYQGRFEVIQVDWQDA